MSEGNPNCDLCRMSQSATNVCVMGTGPRKAKIMVIGKMPNSDRYQAALNEELTAVGLDPSQVYFTQAVKCRNFDRDPGRTDIKTCARTYLDQEIADVQPEHILVLGNEALSASTGHSGITNYRGRIIEREGAEIIPTISPSAINRNPAQRPGFVADLRLFSNRVLGRASGIRVPKYTVIDTREKLKKLKEVLTHCEMIHYDLETHSEDWRPDGKIISMAGTCQLVIDGQPKMFYFVLPLYHPESPFKRTWKAVLKYLAPVFAQIRKASAHNGKYDEKWVTRFEAPIQVTFDTMLAIHLLDENIQKGLKPQAQARLGVPPWGVDTKNLLSMPLVEVLEYNFLDTFYMYHLYIQLKQELIEQPRLLRLFAKLIMPANHDLVFSELRGIWFDLERHKDRKPQAQAKLKAIEDELNSYLPPRDFTDWPKDARGRPLAINYNPSNFARWFLFTWMALPVIARGKEKDDGRRGDPSMAEDVMLTLREESIPMTDQAAVIQLMLDRVEWQKALSSFFNAYEELYDEDHRIHTNFKLAGTVTGRLSSGKTDKDKISGTRGKIRGVNLQQVPRSPFIRGLFGAPHGWTFVEADYSQIELRIAAFLARERHMLQLYAQGADIHLTTAARVAGLPESKVSKEVRKKLGKPVNFGFLYGMGWSKFITTAFTNYGSIFTEQEAKAARRTYFELFPDLIAWHERQRRLVRNNGRVQSPIGRIRHLPDIYSPDQGVRAEAERQAINSPVQGFASDLAVLSMTVINRRLKEQGLAAHCLGLVHDAINFEVRDDHVGLVLPIIKDTMEDMSIVKKKFGVRIDIPIIADLKVGHHWGDSVELTEEQVYDWRGMPPEAA